MANRMHREATINKVNVRDTMLAAATELDALAKQYDNLRIQYNFDLELVAADMHMAITDEDMKYRGSGAVLTFLKKLLDPKS